MQADDEHIAAASKSPDEAEQEAPDETAAEQEAPDETAAEQEAPDETAAEQEAPDETAAAPSQVEKLFETRGKLSEEREISPTLSSGDEVSDTPVKMSAIDELKRAFATPTEFQESDYEKIDGRDNTFEKVDMKNAHMLYVFITKRIKNLKIHSEQFHKFIVAIGESVKYRCDNLQTTLELNPRLKASSRSGQYVTGTEELVDNVRKAIQLELLYYTKAHEHVLQPLATKLGEQTEKLVKELAILIESANALQNLHNQAEALLRKKMGDYCNKAQKSRKGFFVAARVYKFCILEYWETFKTYVPNLQKIMICLEHLEKSKAENELAVQRQFMDCLLDIQFKVTKDLKRVSRKARAWDPETEWAKVMDEVHYIQEDGRTLVDSIVPCRTAALIHAWFARDIVMELMVGYRTKKTAWKTVFASVTRAGFMHLFEDKLRTEPIAALILQDYDVEMGYKSQTYITLVPTDTSLIQNLKLFHGHVYLSCKSVRDTELLLGKICEFKAKFGEEEHTPQEVVQKDNVRPKKVEINWSHQF